MKEVGPHNPELELELAARRESDERMHFALAAAGIGVWEWDLPSDGVTWSSTTALAFGLSPDKAPMSGRAFFELIHPDDRQSLAATADRAIRDRRDIVTDFRSISPDGSVRWMELQGRVAYDTDEKPLRALGVNIDISGRKLLEERLGHPIGRCRVGGRVPSCRRRWAGLP